MEKAILIVNSKKGVCEGKIQFRNGIPWPLEGFNLTEKMNNKVCEVYRDAIGQIQKIVVDRQELTKKDSESTQIESHQTANQRTSAENGGKHENNQKYGNSGGNVQAGNTDNEKHKSTVTAFSEKTAKAPYNFIPLNKTVVRAEFASREQMPGFDTYDTDSYTGYIEYQLETVTPLYIRDTFESLSKDDKVNPDFFSPASRRKIPGSSIRGMTRTLVETVSWGKFENFEKDKLLYYRTMADKCKSVMFEYQGNMSSGNYKAKTLKYKFYAGYLTKEDFDYYIIPAEKSNNGKQFVRFKKSDKTREFVVEKKSDGRYLVVSGHMKLKELDWLINQPDFKEERIPIPEEDVVAYEKDVNRYADKNGKKDGDLFRQLRASKEEFVPCFYVRWKDSKGNDRISFGHTGYFRLAYKKSIGDHVPVTLKDNNIIDLAGAVFGEKSLFATRVFFEDVEIISGQKNVLEKVVSPKILSSPKPTTFQHYLEQKNNDINNLLHWNSEASIRGYKYYWHRNNPEWSEGAVKKSSQHTVITAVRTGVSFKGRIRFENLSNVELGSLMFVLDLPENHCHKLGMGKPLGLGSVKIKPVLFISDRKQRYEKLFTENGLGWSLSEFAHETESFKSYFEGYVLSNISEDEKLNANSLWETERLKHLKVMLNWNNAETTGWLEKTRYMEITDKGKVNEFKNRPVLLAPIDYINS